jgi:hypothetical protein
VSPLQYTDSENIHEKNIARKETHSASVLITFRNIIVKNSFVPEVRTLPKRTGEGSRRGWVNDLSGGADPSAEHNGGLRLRTSGRRRRGDQRYVDFALYALYGREGPQDQDITV